MTQAHSHQHHDPSHLAHHFDTPRQQYHAAKIGLWIFLATEILMFGGLFVAYSVWRSNHPEVFSYAHSHLITALGALNTVILITSSFTMAWGVRAAQLNQKKLLAVLIGLTFMGGVGFLCVKTIEYSTEWHHNLWVGPWNLFHPNYDGWATPEELDKEAGLTETHEGSLASVAAASTSSDSTLPKPEVTHLPAAGDQPQGMVTDFVEAKNDLAMEHKTVHHPLTYEDLSPVAKKNVHQFFQLYFLMTGLHTIHVIIGMCLMVWIFVKAVRGTFSSHYFTPVDLVGLYWHLVDLIWIFLFPLLYLIH